MSDEQAKPYTVVGVPVHQNRWNEKLQTTESGWLVRVQWLATGSVIPIFVPDSADLAATVDQLARFYGAQLDALHA